MPAVFLVLVFVAVSAEPMIARQERAAATTPPGGQKTAADTVAMVLAGKDAEAVAICEQWVARQPAFADGYLMLGGAHETLGKKIIIGDVPGGRPAATKHLETAVAHFTRVIELKGTDAEFMHYQVLADVYDVVGLNRPQEHERVVRAAVKRFPAEPMAHSYLITLVATGNEPLEPAVRAARASIPPVPKRARTWRRPSRIGSGTSAGFMARAPRPRSCVKRCRW